MRKLSMNILHTDLSDPSSKRFAFAYLLADHLLDGKVDKQGQLIIDHCLRVFESCRLSGLSDDQQLAAILHDCIEDGRISALQVPEANHTYWVYSIVEKLFGIYVASLVLGLSRIDTYTSYRVYIQCVGENRELAQIKIEDLKENLDPARGPIDNSLRSRYEEALFYLVGKVNQ